jgi:hypothetical protein
MNDVLGQSHPAFAIGLIAACARSKGDTGRFVINFFQKNGSHQRQKADMGTETNSHLALFDGRQIRKLVISPENCKQLAGKKTKKIKGSED